MIRVVPTAVRKKEGFKPPPFREGEGDTPTHISRQPSSAVLLELVKIIENWFQEGFESLHLRELIGLI